MDGEFALYALVVLLHLILFAWLWFVRLVVKIMILLNKEVDDGD
jgi:hypothetical protein